MRRSVTMFSKLFIDTLANFLSVTLQEKSVTKVKVKKLLSIFIKMWTHELKENKKNAKKV